MSGEKTSSAMPHENKPLFDGSLVNADGTYRLTMDQLVEGRMVINPYMRETIAGSRTEVQDSATIADTLPPPSRTRRNTSGNTTRTSAMHEMIDSEDTDIMSEERLSVSENIRQKLGSAAAWCVETPSRLRDSYRTLPRQRDVMKDDTDKNQSTLSRIGNRLKTKGGVLAGIGSVALAAVAGASVGHQVETIEKAQKESHLVLAGIDYAIVQNNFSTTAILVGGNTQYVPPSDEMIAKGFADGVNIEGYNYIASMGIGAGEPSAAVSQADAVPGLVNSYWENHNAGIDTKFVPYSWGTVVTAQALKEIKDQNGGVWPEDLQVTMIAYPGAQGGGFDGPFGGIAMKMFNVEPGSMELPPGSTIVYYDADPFATSGQGQAPLTDLENIVLTAVGSHAIPNMDDPNFVEYVDMDGVIHRVYHFDAAAAIGNALGIQIMDTASANAALEALFPHNSDPTSYEIPAADVGAAIYYGAVAMDRQIDPTGNFVLFERIASSMPGPWIDLMNSGWNGFNLAAAAVGNAMSNPTQENLQAAQAAVMDAIRCVMGDVQGALRAPIGNSGKSIESIIQTQLYNATGVDYSPQIATLNTLGTTLAQSAQIYKERAATRAAIVEQNKQYVENDPQLKYMPTPADRVKTAVTNIQDRISERNENKVQSTLTPNNPALTPVFNRGDSAPAAPVTPLNQQRNNQSPITTNKLPIVNRFNQQAPIEAASPAPVAPPKVYTPPAAPAAAIAPIQAPAPAPAPVKPAPIFRKPVIEAPAPAPVAPPKVYTPPPAPVFTPPAPERPVAAILPPAPAPAAPVFTIDAPRINKPFQLPNIGGGNPAPAFKRNNGSVLIPQ